MNNNLGWIFDIQRFAVHDGPGIRTTVFFKGCSNFCGWCHNPESIIVKPQLQYFPQRCISCGNCVERCLQGCHRLTDGKHSLDRTTCNACGLCALSCYCNAVLLSGKPMTTEEVLKEVLADIAYYRQSGGGVTLSGGEPVLQYSFCAELLKQLKHTGIHTVIQTAGNYDYALLEMLLPFIDLVMYDIKAYSPEIYDRHIHGDRDIIFENLIKLDRENKPIVVRTPVVGSVNDNPGEIALIAGFLQDIKNLKQYVLLPYHGLGKAKYDLLGHPYNNDYYTPAIEDIAKLEKVAALYVPVAELNMSK